MGGIDMFGQELKKMGIATAYRYIEKNPKDNLRKLMTWVDRIAGEGPDSFEEQRKVIWDILDHPESNMYQLIMRVIEVVDPEVVKTVFSNFFLNAAILGWPKQEKLRAEYNCNIPWAILLDPTSACNLHCTGCWAAEYGNKLNLTFDEIDSIIEQGKELGIYFYIYTGGEPLVRKNDLIALCKKHSDCIFLSFTNATLIDEAFADDMLRVKNFIPAISVEGDMAAHDGRRGKGSYEKVEKAMKLLKEKKLPFGVSCCYTSANCDSISSDEFYDWLVDKGVLFAWYFHYMPVGNDAAPDLLPTKEQREYMYHRVREIRGATGGKPIYAMDFQNDGEFVGGCIAGGRNYCHINANGDVEPCVFIHYSGANINEVSLIEALQQPLFQAYRDGQPFNRNHLRPCPMLENPELLREMVEKTGAKSTDLQSPESAEHLCGKCDLYAAEWKKAADELWAENPHHKQRYENYKKENLDEEAKASTEEILSGIRG